MSRRTKELNLPPRIAGIRVTFRDLAEAKIRVHNAQKQTRNKAYKSRTIEQQDGENPFTEPHEDTIQEDLDTTAEADANR